WSQLSYWATTVATAIPGSVPLAGPYLVELIRGAAKVDAETLNRFFALHVVVIPAVLLAFIGMHLLLVRILGISDPRDRQPTKPQETQEENAPETKIP
ncbi:MAG: cytochrome b N-terminal domain-containing protein, partial [Nitrospinaceae bacterium]